MHHTGRTPGVRWWFVKGVVANINVFEPLALVVVLLFRKLCPNAVVSRSLIKDKIGHTHSLPPGSSHKGLPP